MRHKIRVRSSEMSAGRRLWYASCSCRWEPNTPVAYAPGEPSFFGRSTFAAALAEGVAHQQQVLRPLARSHSA